MALVLTTTLRIGITNSAGKFSEKVVEEGTPYGDLNKKEKTLAKELGLLAQAPDEEPDLDEEIEEADYDEEDEDEEAETEDSKGAGGSEEE